MLLPSLRASGVDSVNDSLSSSERLKNNHHKTDVVKRDETLTEFFGTGESPVVIYDEQLERRGKSERAQLRSIPLFLELGANQFVYDGLWARELQLVEHGYLSPDAVAPSVVSFPLVHVVTGPQLRPRDEQEYEYEEISQADLTWELLRAATGESATGQYVLVTDTDAPHIPSRTPVEGRSAADQFNAVTFEYRQLLQEYVTEHVDSKLPLNYTENLYFHRVSEHHAEHGAPSSTLPELFDYERAPADSPIWEPLHYFIEYELKEVLDEYEAHVTTTLRSWIERGDTGKIARRMIATLHRCDFNEKQLTEYRHNPQR